MQVPNTSSTLPATVGVSFGPGRGAGFFVKANGQLVGRVVMVARGKWAASSSQLVVPYHSYDLRSAVAALCAASFGGMVSDWVPKLPNYDAPCFTAVNGRGAVA